MFKNKIVTLYIVTRTFQNKNNGNEYCNEY